MISRNDNIKGYIVEDQLGTGGFGTVYLVHKKSSPGKKFALKLLKPQFLRESSRREKFVNEMINMAKLYAIPSIVTIYDNIIFEDKEGEHQGIVMEHVEGESLDRFIFRHSKLVAAKAVPLFLQILDAIQHAHTLGIIHRDIKPKNIMVLTGETIEYQGYPATHPIRILDFGLAKVTDKGAAQESETMSGISPIYTPPERLLERRIGPYTDIYAVGVTLYEALTGVPPFQIKSIQDIERVITKEKPSSILAHYEHHPSALNDVVQKALAKTPEDRYISCAEFGAALAMAYPPSQKNVVIDEEKPITDNGNDNDNIPKQPSSKKNKNNSKVSTLLAGFLLVLFVVGAYFFYSILSNDPLKRKVAMQPGPSSSSVIQPTNQNSYNNQKNVQQVASLTVKSKPLGAKIFWNGAEYGNTPNTIRNVLKGTYRLILKKENYEDYDETVTLNEITEKELFFELVKKVGSWYVESVPSGARLYLDGESIGLTPLWTPERPYGSYKLEIKHEGYNDYVGSLDITDNSKRKIEVELVKIMGAIKIKSHPTYASVYWDDERKGITDILIADIPLGNHRLKIQKDGYKPYEATIPVTDGHTIEREYTLEEIQMLGSLYVESVPSGARLYLDGESKGSTPQWLRDIPYGSYQLEIKKNGYRTYSESIQIANDSKWKVEAKLIRMYTLERNDRCTDGKLNSAQIRALVTNKKAEGISLDRSATWEEIQYRDGTAIYKNKDSGKRFEGKWKIQDDQLCWCYKGVGELDCNDFKCKVIEARNNCSVWYYIDPEKGYKETGKVYFSDI